jgi:hypothetical protein
MIFKHYTMIFQKGGVFMTTGLALNCLALIVNIPEFSTYYKGKMLD